MAEHDKQEEEYHFSELDDSDIYDVPNTEEASSEAPINRPSPEGSPVQKVMVLIILVAVGWFAYKNLFSSKGKSNTEPVSKQEVPTKQPDKPTTPITEVPSSGKTHSPAVAASTALPAPAAVAGVRQEDFDNLNIKATRIEQNLHELNKDIEATKSRLGQIEMNVSALDTRLTEISTSLQRITEQLQPKKPPVTLNKTVKLKTVKASPRQAKQSAKVVYHVKAVIPGRAWLITNDGTTLTISIGSLLPGYGYVKAIDYQHERVILNSGYTLK